MKFMNFIDYQFHTIFIFLIVSVLPAVHSQCKLTGNDLKNEKRIYAHQTAAGHPDLIYRDNVPLGTTIDAYCTTTNVVKINCQNTGIFDKKLPIGNCAKPMKFKSEIIADSTCSHRTYRVGYEMNNDFMEIYRTCYDSQTDAAKYSLHKNYKYDITTLRPQKPFCGDSSLPDDIGGAYSDRYIYQRYLHLLGQLQTYMQKPGQSTVRGREDKFDKGHLVPSNDYLFPSTMCATFYYPNAVAQFHAINNGNWKVMEAWIRKKLTYTDEAKTATGALGILELRATDRTIKKMYLLDTNRLPIPLWTYKIVKLNSGLHAFVTYNNIYDTTAPSTTGICNSIPCPTDLHLTQTASRGFTFCCQAQAFINTHVPSLSNYFK